MDASSIRSFSGLVFGLIAIGLAYAVGLLQGEHSSKEAPAAPVSAPSVAAASAPMTASVTTPAAPQMPPLFTPEERAELTQARQKVLTTQPDLKTEETTLIDQQKVLMTKGQAATPEERQDLFKKWHAHGDKMRAAMVAADPNLTKVFAEMDARRAQQIQQLQAQNKPAMPGGLMQTATH